jgi:hypothetical protein
MKIDRAKFAQVLEFVSVALPKAALNDYSDCFAFDGDIVAAVSQGIVARARMPGLDLHGEVPSDDLRKLIRGLPDDQITVSSGSGEMRISGKRRKAGLCFSEKKTVNLSDLSKPGKWSKIPDGVAEKIYRASLVSGTDESWRITTCVRVEKNVIEACDNFRMFQAKGKTGFPQRVLIPREAAELAGKQEMKSISIEDGWAHLRCDVGVVSIALWDGTPLDIDKFLKLEGEKVTLPKAELVGATERSRLLGDDLSSYLSNVHVHIVGTKATVSGNGKKGWYKEIVAVKYDGPDLEFDIRPDCLLDLISRSTDVTVGKRMRIDMGDAVFAVILKVT